MKRTKRTKKATRISNFVGMPAALKLDEFASHVWSVFGSPPYIVGSAVISKAWRDVDVRMILSDEDFVAMGLGDPGRGCHNAKWVSLCLAYAALGREMTGLPIDFQIQQRTYANETYDGPRLALGFVPMRIAKYEEKEKATEPVAEVGAARGQRSDDKALEED